MDLKTGICSLYQVKEDQYKAFMMKRTLFRRVRVVRPFVSLFVPHYLFNEERLIENIATAENLKEIQKELDFYQHKYVVNSVFKDALRFRISGMRIMSLANQAFNHMAKQANPSGS
ncbi:MAG: hypothetical protein AB3N33_01895 [Puniceicoccaceae bacterium]